MSPFKSKIIIYECPEGDNSSKKLIHDMEDLRFMRGKIEFAFDCVDIIPDNSKYQVGAFTTQKQLFHKIYSVIRSSIYFNDDITHNFRRVLFACGDHKFYNYWCTYSYSLELWKRKAILNCDDLFYYFRAGEYKKYLKEALLYIAQYGSEEEAVKALSLKDFGADVPNWVVRLIKDPNLLDKHCGGYHYFAVKDNVCYLFNGAARPSDMQALFKVE